MTRLVLLSMLCVVTWYYFPETRAILHEAAERVLRPYTALGAIDEMERVGRNVVSHERLTGELPTDEGAWQAWLDERYRNGTVVHDRWGATYGLRVWPDSVGIVSAGPDGLPGTDDDMLVATPRG
ncbi:MAG: hypothetical protein U5R14_11280 [Gemmatimonadota bacterium]|nr:hypothetical protein [Gemmatimonadota bacterium]